MTRRKTSLLEKAYLTLFMILLYAPIVVLMVFSFNSSNSTSVMSGFSLKWYAELFRDGATIAAFRNTVVLAVVSAAFSTVFGLFSAIGINYTRSRWYKSSLLTTTNIPMMNPDIVTGISMMLLFVFAGTLMRRQGVLGFGTMLIAHITFQLPYVILNILPRFRAMDGYLTEAAQDLGCTPSQAFFKVTLPQIRPGVIAGAIMAFTLSLDDFVISYFVSGPEFQTLPIRIYSMTKKRVTPDMYALSTLIFLVMLLLLIALNVIQNRAENGGRGKSGKQVEP
ncbi:MAG: ABC transporter permease [Clostridia bacterium]|nr:ABC transporter permease [Clostridia bacterium]MBR5753441.1 ABC transporter permease [Clostridia bacterium]